MRMAIMLVVGLLIGCLGGIKIYQTLSASTALPRAVMTLTGYHFSRLGEAIKSGQCSAEATSADVQAMTRLAQDIEPVFLPTNGPQDQVFIDHADKLREGIATMQLAFGNCDQLASARKQTFQACKSCHQDYR